MLYPMLLDTAGDLADLAQTTPAAVSAENAFTLEGAMIVAQFDLGFITLNLTQTIIVQWIVLVIVGCLFFFLGRNLKVVPTTKKQMFAEWIGSFFINNVKDSMGPRYHRYVPYIACVMCFSIFSSYSSLLGFRSPTTDLSVLATWAGITFILVQRNRLRTGGFRGYFKHYLEPVAPLLPLNIIGEFTSPLSQAFRHFGNILSGAIVMGLIYWALGSFAVILPAVLSLYFDLFSGAIQAFIFGTLTMVYVGNAERQERIHKCK